MKSTNQGNVVSANIVAKSGFWYTISNFLFRAIVFITTPIFVRLLSKNEFGEFNNIISWVSLLSVLTACDLYTSIIRAKLDFEDDIDRYSSSVLTLGSIITFVCFILTRIFNSEISAFTGIKEEYFYIIYIYLFFIQGYHVFATKARAQYKYKVYSLSTGIGIVASCLLSLLLVIYMDDKLIARIYGYFMPYILIGVIFYFLIMSKGKSVDFKYYKYSLGLSLPLVPHVLSMTILASSDKIMITRYAGVEFTAIYSLACIVSHIGMTLIDSMNKAWAPWFLETLKRGDLNRIKKASNIYFFTFAFGLTAMILLGPEIVFILGGEKYKEGVYVLLPLLLGNLFQFSYTMYVQIEFFEKKMKGVSMATLVAALLNIMLNYFFIPIFGYIATGYTTLVGYIILFIIHFWIVQKMGYTKIFDNKVIISTLAIAVMLLPIVLNIYHVTLVRYFLLSIITIVGIFLSIKKGLVGYLPFKI